MDLFGLGQVGPPPAIPLRPQKPTALLIAAPGEDAEEHQSWSFWSVKSTRPLLLYSVAAKHRALREKRMIVVVQCVPITQETQSCHCQKVAVEVHQPHFGWDLPHGGLHVSFVALTATI